MKEAKERIVLTKREREDRDNLIVNLYTVELLNSTEIGKRLGMTSSGISKILRMKNVVMRKRGGNTFKHLIVNPFTRENKEKSSYWLGYLAADGSISKDGKRSNLDGTTTVKQKNLISISSTDLDHLEKFREYVCPTLNTNFKDYKTSEEEKKVLGTVFFSSKPTKDWLIARGITPNKTFTLKVSESLLTNHFIRGVFDADGSISNARPKITTGSKEFMLQLEETFRKHNIVTSVVLKGNAFDIYILNQSKLKFYNYIYSDATIFMARKNDKSKWAFK